MAARSAATLLLALLALRVSASPTGDGDCQSPPAFRRLLAAIAHDSAAVAASRLERFIKADKNPVGCEFDLTEVLLAEKERKLFTLTANRRAVFAQLVYRCDSVDPVTTLCLGPTQDLTPHPYTLGVSPLSIPGGLPAALNTSRNGSQLSTVSAIDLGKSLDGGPATPLDPDQGRFTIPNYNSDIAIVAIYQTQGTWKFRKVVWYLVPRVLSAATDAAEQGH